MTENSNEFLTVLMYIGGYVCFMLILHGVLAIYITISSRRGKCRPYREVMKHLMVDDPFWGYE